jgi:lipid-A-disaccharide synthase
MNVMLSCGEPSGDLYAGALTTEIHRLSPASRIFGMGGGSFSQAGGQLLSDYRGLTVTGLTEALRVIPRSLAEIQRLVAAARSEKPDVFVAIDFPDFNFRLASAINRLGIPVVYYVSPQLWAWRAGRIRTLKRIARRVLVIFPFEVSVYERAGIAVEFVGHPLVDLAHAAAPRAELLAELGLDAAAPTIALLPGSRPNEVSRLLPVLLDARGLVRRQVPSAQFVIARAPGLDDRLFDRTHREADPGTACVTSRTDDVLSACDAVVTASGTATVQAALHDRPMVIVYKLSPLTYRVGRPFVRVTTYGMVNLVAGRSVVPELIQDECTPDRVAAELISLLTDTARIARVRHDLADVRARLGGSGASRRAAQAVLRVAEKRRSESR